mgnify:CR=1 FL=1
MPEYYVDYSTHNFNDLDPVQLMAERLGGYVSSEGSCQLGNVWYVTARYFFETKEAAIQFRKRVGIAQTAYLTE